MANAAGMLIVAVIGIPMAIAAGCCSTTATAPASATGTTPDLAADAQREYRILAPSLEQAASDLVRRMQVVTSEEAGRPVFSSRVATTTKDDGDKVTTQTIATVEASETTLIYRSLGVEDIVRTNSVAFPFLGTVSIGVTTAERHGEEAQTLDGDVPVPRLERETARLAIGLPVPPAPNELPADTPDWMKALGAKATNACLHAPLKESTASYHVSWNWSVKDGKWLAVPPPRVSTDR